jgi:integrase
MAKRVPALTAAQVMSLKPDPSKVVELVDGAVPGLRLRLTPSGTRSWSLNVRAGGVMRRFKVGAGLGLADARKKADELRREIHDGVDPTAVRKATRTRASDAKKGVGTLEAIIIETYFEKGPGAALRSKDEQRRRLRSVFAEHLRRPGIEITEAELQRTIDGHGAKTAAGRAVAYLGPIIKWAAKRELLNTRFDLDKPSAHQEVDGELGQRVLTPDELKAILPRLSGPQGHCCKLMLLTAARLSEATEATWSEIDVEAQTWTISPVRRKDTRSRNRKKQVPAPPHVIPLPPQALSLLQQIRSAEAARRLAAGESSEIDQSTPIFIGERGGRLQNWDRWFKKRGWAHYAVWRLGCWRKGTLWGCAVIPAFSHI